MTGDSILKVFLCGPITNVTDGCAFNPTVRRLIETISEKLESAGFTVLSAHKEELFGTRIPEQPSEVFQRDWTLAQTSNAMVFVLPSDIDGQLIRTDGTFMELGWAIALKKTFFILTESHATGRSYLFDGLLENLPQTQIFGFDEAIQGNEFIVNLREQLC